MNTEIDSIVTNCTLNVVPDLIQESRDTLQTEFNDTTVCSTSISADETINNFWLKDNQPSGWTQLFIAVCVPLFVVFLEKWITKGITNKKGKNERKKYRKTVIDWIRLIDPIETNLSESLSALSDLVEQSDDMQPERYAMPTTIPDKLGALTVEQMMDAFMTDFKGDKRKCSTHVYNIISCLEFLSKTKDKITNAYDSYNKQSFSCCKQWNSELDEFKKWKLQQNNESINRIVGLWAASLIVKKDSILAHEKLVNDILQLYSSDSNITPTLIRMRNILLQRKALSSGFASVFDNLSQNINVSLQQLSEACVFFENNNSF